MSSEDNRKPLIEAYKYKLRALKSATREKLNPLINTSGNFKVLSPKTTHQIKSNLNRTKLSLERSTSSHKAQNFLLNCKAQGLKRQISQKDEAKFINSSKKSYDGHQPSIMDIQEMKDQLNTKFLKESKENNIGACLQLLEPTLVHNILRLPSHLKINYEIRANINTQDCNGNTALHFAVRNGNSQLVSALIYKQIIIDLENAERMTALILAAYHGNDDIMVTLLSAGADANHQDMYGNTALHYGCKFSHKGIVYSLLKKSSLIFKVNHEQKYPDYYIKNEEILILFANFHEEHQKQKKKTEDIKIQTIENDVLFRMFTSNASQGQLPLQSQTHFNHVKFSNSPTNKFQDLIKERQKQQQQCTPKNNKPPLINSLINVEKIIKEEIGPTQFQVIGLIGKGSFGEVYLVKKQQQLYAMKVLHKSMIIKQNLYRYVQTERNVLSITSHPFIVKLRYAFQTQDKLFMILDYCPGGDLGQVLAKVKRLPEELVKLYLCEVILALEDLHTRDIIFRDLKPDNIVIDCDGHVLLTDFGLSKEGILESSTGAKSFCGSIAYMAPEMLKRQGHGKSVDWYLLGVVMYELIFGLPPFYSNDREELFHNIENANLKIPSSISSEGRNLLKSLLQRNPAKRLGSGKGDSEEIKAHPYFKDIDWNVVLNREIDLPKPNRKIKIKTQMEHNVFDSQSFVDSENSHIDGWSFVHTE